jgi:hypothetical protein
LEIQPQRFVMLGINASSYNTIVWVTSQLFGTMNSSWLSRKLHASVLDTFHSLVTKIRNPSLLPNIRDDAINAIVGFTQGSMSYAT